MTAAFTGPLAAELESFLEFKRSLGYRYYGVASVLRSLDHFFGEAASIPRSLQFDEALLRWLEARATHRKPTSLLYDVSVARQFCAYLRRRHPRREIREPFWPRLPSSRFVPSILSVSEVQLLLRRARQLDHPAFRRDLFRMLLLVLYCTGLRLGEALRLRLRDVDVGGGVLFVAESKGRSRWVPFHPSLSREIARYLVARRAFAPAGLDDPFFVGVKRRWRLGKSSASGVVTKLLRDAGLKPPSGRVGPRTHDLRHTFAVHRLTRWYRGRVDAQARLPWLSAYMGHTDIVGTERYLTATPELLALAERRFQRRFRGSRKIA